MSEARGVTFHDGEHVATITLTRPDAANAMDIPATLALKAAIDAAEASSAGAILLVGEGKRFCAGGDVAAFASATAPKAYLLELATDLEAQTRRLSSLRKPVIAAVQGAVAGAGLSFVLNADYVVAARGTKFVLAYSGIGLTPDCGVSYLLPRAVGLKRALTMAIGGRVLTADEAEAWGLVSEVVDDDQVHERAAALAAKVAAGSQDSWSNTKRLLWESVESTREANASDEAHTISKLAGGDAASALISAFVGGR